MIKRARGAASGRGGGRKPAQGEAGAFGSRPPGDGSVVDLKRRHDQLKARVAELQWDLGGLVYEMAIRNRIRVEVLVQRAAVLQEADAELGEVERILRLEETGMAGACANCGSPHSVGASFCWQCGQPLLAQVSPDAVSS
jgi:hypothetical protein